MTLMNFDLCPAVRERADYLAHCPQTGLAEQVDVVLKKLASPLDIAAAIETIHRLQRLYLAHALDVATHPTIISALNDPQGFPWWSQFTALKTTPEKQAKLAKLMVHGDPQMRHPVIMNLCDYSRGVGEKAVEELINAEQVFDLWIEDPYFHRRLLHVMDDSRATAYGKILAHRCEVSARAVTFRATLAVMPVDPPAPPQINRIVQEVFSREKSEKFPTQFYTLTALPTEKDAVLDLMTYDDYIDLFFRMCDVDWSRVDAAHKILIAQLNAGKNLRITNEDGTDISMDIDGFTFANSLVAKNVPGSEVFSAPRRDSVNGVIVAKGRFIPKTSGGLIENLTLHIKDGRIVDYAADTGFDVLRELIETDEGSHYFGEIGIGTNPVLQQHLTNSLLVEKIGGSFHMAIGAAYEYTDYLGVPVALDNGNRSMVHVDLTTMLVGKAGMMYLDGAIIMRDGRFVDPALGYLNGSSLTP